MSKYPLIQEMGLQITYLKYPCENNIVTADDLEKALQAAPLWYGDKDLDSWSTVKVWADTTHTARLVCIQPIKKKTKAEAALEFVNKLADPVPGLRFFDLLNEAKKISEMKD